MQPRVAAAAAAKPTVLNAQSPSGLHRVLQRTRRPPPRGTVRFHSEEADGCIHRTNIKGVIAPRGREARGGAWRAASYPHQ